MSWMRRRIRAESSWGVICLPRMSNSIRPFSRSDALNCTDGRSSFTSSRPRPMKRFTEKMVFCGLVMAWRLAGAPTRRSPSFLNATTEVVVRPPSALGMTVGSSPSITATTEFVVPRSMPMILPMLGVGFLMRE